MQSENEIISLKQVLFEDNAVQEYMSHCSLLEAWPKDLYHLLL